MIRQRQLLYGGSTRANPRPARHHFHDICKGFAMGAFGTMWPTILKPQPPELQPVADLELDSRRSSHRHRLNSHGPT